MLGDTLAAALPQLRAEAESRMRSVARIERITGVTPDPMTGHDVVTVEIVHGALPCRLRQRTMMRDAEDSAGGATIPVQSPELHVPWDTPGLQVGMRAVITASEAPHLVGVMYRLAMRPEGEQVTAQRWGVESWTNSLS